MSRLRSRLARLVVVGLLLPASSPAEAGAVRREKTSGLEARFVPTPWRPDLFRSLEEGGSEARSWAFAHLVVSSYFTLDGARLGPGHYALVLNPKTGPLPMTLELRRVDGREFLDDAAGGPPPGPTVYKAPAAFVPGSEPTPGLDLTLAGGREGAVLTVRYGDRKLVKELPRASMP